MLPAQKEFKRHSTVAQKLRSFVVSEGVEVEIIYKSDSMGFSELVCMDECKQVQVPLL